MAQSLRKALPQQASDTLQVIDSGLKDTCATAKVRAIRSYKHLGENLRLGITRVAQQVRRAKEERPLQSLAVIAGMSFAVGVAFRMWRSRHDD